MPPAAGSARPEFLRENGDAESSLENSVIELGESGHSDATPVDREGAYSPRRGDISSVYRPMRRFYNSTAIAVKLRV